LPILYAHHHTYPYPHTPRFAAITTFFGYGVLVAFGHLRDFFGQFSGQSRYLATIPPKGYAPLLQSWENFYTRRLYHRIQDCWNRPVCSSPGATIDIVCRSSKDGNKTLSPDGNVDAGFLNLGSYNYLGFADDWINTCSKDVIGSLDDFNVNCSSAPMDLGTTTLHKHLEKVTADFVGKPASIIFNMGYGTNACTIPALMGKGSLIISDSLNHTSIVNGARASGAKIMTFKHNDVENLEAILKRAIVQGQPRSHRPWSKILVMVEGIYSMEGEICNLRGVIDTCKKYKAYSYVDEAHSIGALGKTGRGICEYCGVDPSEVDILMGTFTKSFGAMGGYIASSQVQSINSPYTHCTHGTSPPPRPSLTTCAPTPLDQCTRTACPPRYASRSSPRWTSLAARTARISARRN
jgi:serine palmitoyltransferase